MTPLGVALLILFAATGWWIGQRVGEWAETSEPEAEAEPASAAEAVNG